MNVLLMMSSLYEDEGWLGEIENMRDSVVLDLRGISGTNSFCCDEASSEIEAALAPLPLRSLHWIDTGDYHYLSEIWLRKADRDFALILIDNHSDRQESTLAAECEMLSCGNWVTVAERTNPHIKPLSSGIPVYISIDTDALSQDFARTNWDQGELTLDALIAQLDAIRAEHEIIGADICGGLTIAKGASADDLTTNCRLRKTLLDYFSGMFE